MLEDEAELCVVLVLSHDLVLVGKFANFIENGSVSLLELGPRVFDEFSNFSLDHSEFFIFVLDFEFLFQFINARQFAQQLRCFLLHLRNLRQVQDRGLVLFKHACALIKQGLALQIQVVVDRCHSGLNVLQLRNGESSSEFTLGSISLCLGKLLLKLGQDLLVLGFGGGEGLLLDSHDLVKVHIVLVDKSWEHELISLFCFGVSDSNGLGGDG